MATAIGRQGIPCGRRVQKSPPSLSPTCPCTGAWDRTFVTAWPPVLTREGRGRAGAYWIHDSSLLIYFVYTSFLRFLVEQNSGH